MNNNKIIHRNLIVALVSLVLVNMAIGFYASFSEIKNFGSSSISYKVQDNYSETVNFENKSIDDLLNKTFQDLIIKLTESMV